MELDSNSRGGSPAAVQQAESQPTLTMKRREWAPAVAGKISRIKKQKKSRHQDNQHNIGCWKNIRKEFN